MSEEDPQIEELRRKREERRRLQEEEERREAEERQRKEEERRLRKVERDRKAKEREDAHAREIEEKQRRDQREEEKRKRKEERERLRLEEERKEREEEERKQKEREEKRRQQEEQEEEERRKRREALRKSQDEVLHHDRGEESRPDSRRRQRIEKLLNIIRNTENIAALEKIVADEDLKEEATKLLQENHDAVGDFFSKQDTITTILKYISTIHPNPQALTDDQRDDILTRMEFAKEAISGGVPTLWRVLLQPENRHYLEQLFALFHHDDPQLPPINVTTFWKSVEFLIYRRGYEITNFMYSQKEKILASFFRHLRDTNFMDMMFKFVEKETISNPAYKDYDPKKDTSVVNESLYWTDDLPDMIVAYARNDDDEWSDISIDNLGHFLFQIMEKFPNCKLSYQLREARFTLALVSVIVPQIPAINGSNGTLENGVKGHTNHNLSFKHQSTLVALVSLVIQFLKYSVNTSSYSTETLPSLVSSLIYGNMGKESVHEYSPINTIKIWLAGKAPTFDHSHSHHGKSNKFSVLRVKCLQLIKALLFANFKWVDVVMRDLGVLRACVDLFFQYVDNNIIHSLVEEIVKMFITRELSSLDEDNNMQITQYLLDDCDLVARLVATLRDITINRNRFAHFHPPKLTLDDLAKANGKAGHHPAEKERHSPSPDRNPKSVAEKEKPFLPPAFVGHVMSICKAITHASEKSVKIRHLVASCSEYHWGQTVLFHLGMRDSADMEWKKPFQKVDTQDAAHSGSPVVD